MTVNNTANGGTYLYKHLSDAETLRLDDIRQTAKEMDQGYSGYFLLTRSEYCMMLPMLNPVVIAWNTRAYRQMCRSVNVSKETKRAMRQNLLLASLVGFVPIANIAFSRKFKCTTRNLEILEAQIQEDEFKHEKKQRKEDGECEESSDQTGNIDELDINGKRKRITRRTRKKLAAERFVEAPLPSYARQLFNKCPRFVRNSEFPHIAYTSAANQGSSKRNSVATVYYSPRTSLNLEDLEDLDILSHIKANASANGTSIHNSFTSRSSDSDVTLTEQPSALDAKSKVFGTKTIAAVKSKGISRRMQICGSSKQITERPLPSFAKAAKEISNKSGPQPYSTTATTLKPIYV
ncbi:hypothetical protein GGH99_005156 [Coemansia sp. RSA 1285]|nr:hypothetical protein EV177_008487 [Coemansia sp. RSA 1804]KAJ2681537.1 hypothetical protein GGH99_005156 [Coemansia sp. RSA 1285]